MERSQEFRQLLRESGGVDVERPAHAPSREGFDRAQPSRQKALQRAAVFALRQHLSTLQARTSRKRRRNGGKHGDNALWRECASRAAYGIEKRVDGFAVRSFSRHESEMRKGGKGAGAAFGKKMPGKFTIRIRGKRPIKRMIGKIRLHDHLSRQRGAPSPALARTHHGAE